MCDFMELVHSYWSEADFPSLQKLSKWRVHLLKPSQWFKHHSLLVENTDMGECFTIELVISRTAVVPFTRRFDMSAESHSHLEAVDLGTVQSSAVQLFNMALKCLQDFGDYHRITNNCQSFCQVQTASYTYAFVFFGWFYHLFRGFVNGKCLEQGLLIE